MKLNLEHMQSITEALGWTIVHFLWQGALLAGILWLLLAALRRSGANLRYTVSGIAMLAMLGCTIFTFSVEFGKMSLVPEPELEPAIAHRISQELIAEGAAEEVIEVTSSGALMPLAVGESVESAEPSAPDSNDVKAIDATPETPLVTSRLRMAMPWLVGLWALGVLAFSLRLLRSWILVRSLESGGKEFSGGGWQRCFEELCQQMRISRPVRLLSSSTAAVPMVIGWLKPVILIPTRIVSGFSEDQIEAILAHELAHVRRYDYLVNFLQTLVETLLFFHPAVWWVGAQLRKEREHCCDDMAAEIAGDAVGYAQALAALEGMRVSAEPSLSMAVDGGSLIGRVRRLVGCEEAQRPVWPVLVALSGMIASLLWVGGLPEANAADVEEKESKSEIQIVVRAGFWKLSDGMSLEIDQNVFHGSDVATNAKLRWPKAPNGDVRCLEIGIAADGFASRQPWAVVWESDKSILWIAKGALGSTSNQAWGFDRGDEKKPEIQMLQKIDFSDVDAIGDRTVNRIGAKGFVPKNIVEALGEYFAIPTAEAKNDRPGQVAKTTIEPAFNLLLSERTLDADGKPLGNIPVKIKATRNTVDFVGRVIEGGKRFETEVALARSDAEGRLAVFLSLPESVRSDGLKIEVVQDRDDEEKKALPQMRAIPEWNLSHSDLEDLVDIAPTAKIPARMHGSLFEEKGEPVSGGWVAAVPVSKLDRGLTVGVASSEEDGGFKTIWGVRGGEPLQLVAQIRERVLRVEGGEITLKDGDKCELRLRAKPGSDKLDVEMGGGSEKEDSKVTLRFINGETSEPIAGAEAKFFFEGEFEGRKADEKGELSVPSSFLSPIIRNSTPGFISNHSMPVFQKGESGKQRLAVVILWPGREVSGRVLDPDGRPVTGVDVRVSARVGDVATMGKLGIETAFRSWDHGEYSNWGAVARTDAEGRYSYATPDPEHLLWSMVSCVAKGFAPYSSNTVLRVVKKIPDLKPNDIVLSKGVLVKARIIDADGKPLRFMAATNQRSGDRTPPLSFAQSDEDGNFPPQRLMPGEYAMLPPQKQMNYQKAAPEVRPLSDLQPVFSGQALVIPEGVDVYEVTWQALPDKLIRFDWEETRVGKDATRASFEVECQLDGAVWKTQALHCDPGDGKIQVCARVPRDIEDGFLRIHKYGGVYHFVPPDGGRPSNGVVPIKFPKGDGSVGKIVAEKAAYYSLNFGELPSISAKHFDVIIDGLYGRGQIRGRVDRHGSFNIGNIYPGQTLEVTFRHPKFKVVSFKEKAFTAGEIRSRKLDLGQPD